MISNPIVQVLTVRKSQGADYFVHITVEGRITTPHVFSDRYKAEYEVAYWQYIFFGGPKPHILAYNEETFPNDPA